MENRNINVLSALFLNKDFRNSMDENIDQAIKAEGFDPDDDLINRLKEYGKTNKFCDIETANLDDITSTFTNEIGLEARW